MKKFNLIYYLCLFGALASCKKDNTPKTTTTTKTPVVNAVRDSVAYTIDGKTYTAGGMGLSGETGGGEDANRKLVIDGFGYSLVGVNPDSIIYFQENTFASNSANINFYFVKKFAKQVKTVYYPNLDDVLTMFGAGKYALAEDFQWQNSQNGVAIDVATTNNTYSSYNGYNGLNTIVIPPGFQKNSSFRVTNFVQATDEYGGYNLEAKFNAVVFDATGAQKQLTNGYLRLHFNPIYSVN